MQKIALLYHPKLGESLQLARNLERVLKSKGVATWMGSAWDDVEAKKYISNLDLIVTFGGDGTILRAARMAVPQGTPILSVNMGRFGFLAETQPDEVEDLLPTILSGEYWLEERIMLHAELHRGDEQRASYEALNDVVVGHVVMSRVVRLEAFVDGEHLAHYVADGLIIATPTGSTAYSLAAGGPILHPQLTDLLLTPIAAHRALERSIVLPARSVIEIRLSTEYPAVLTIDGQIDTQLEDGDRILVTVSPHRCNLVRTQPRNYFGRGLLERLKQ
jgi:NAD+ kinase